MFLDANSSELLTVGVRKRQPGFASDASKDIYESDNLEECQQCQRTISLCSRIIGSSF
jgi:hypothetical protein